MYQVHRFVYECFKGEILSNLDVDHIDGSRINNHIDNLQLLTRLKNCQKAPAGRRGNNNKTPIPIVAICVETVLPADKGRCTVVIDKSDYVNKANDLLSDTKVYQPLKRDPTSGYKKKVSDSLKALEESEAIDRALYYKLSPSESVPRFYGLPTIHKQNVPLRPISDGTLSTSVYRKATHTDQYLQFDSHHPLIHKLGVIKTLFHRAETIPSTDEAKAGEREHLKSALGTCGYKDWTFHKALKPQKDQTSSKQSSTTASSTRKFGITLPYVSDVSEKLKRIFGQHQIPVSLKPCNTLRQKLVHPKDEIPQRKQSNIVYAINCQDSDCENYYIGETKQPLHKRMYQHRRPSSTGLNDSAVYTHLKAAKHNFEDKDVIVLDKEHRWPGRGRKLYKYAFTVVDVASRYTEAEPLSSLESGEVVKAFEKNLLKRPA
ncbi:uncharacterized protein [Amphiura filiformis]|uniref:uncharacterized protein n=1 Tax=Amphiura filiformis TaxID=82378 RepID=UPI003B21CA2C